VRGADETWRQLSRILMGQIEVASIMLDVVISDRGSTRWEWRVCDRLGTTIMNGFESSRRAAKYRGDRALFALLASGWHQ
jgi:hypothetical protein